MEAIASRLEAITSSSKKQSQVLDVNCVDLGLLEATPRWASVKCFDDHQIMVKDNPKTNPVCWIERDLCLQLLLHSGCVEVVE